MARRHNEKCRWCSCVCCCFSKKSCSIFKGAVALTSLALSIACAVLMPTYRLVAVLWAVLTVVTFFQLWRCTPCDRDRVRRLVEHEVARYRRAHAKRHRHQSASRYHRHRILPESDELSSSSTSNSDGSRSHSTTPSPSSDASSDTGSSSRRSASSCSSGNDRRKSSRHLVHAPVVPERSPRTGFGLGHHQLPLSLASSPAASSAARHFELYVPVVTSSSRSGSAATGARVDSVVAAASLPHRSASRVGKHVSGSATSSTIPSQGDKHRRRRHGVDINDRSSSVSTG